MALYSTLKEDLKRYYDFAGVKLTKISVWKFLGSCLTPRFMPIVLFRTARFLYGKKLGILARIISTVNFVLFGIEISLRCDIGPGLIFPHTFGTVIGAARIGKNALIYHGVTLGAKKMDLNYDESTRPIVGENVTIGSGAKILGGIHIGNNATIGANAVVLKSVPDNVMVGGIPAKIIRSSETNELVS